VPSRASGPRLAQEPPSSARIAAPLVEELDRDRLTGERLRGGPDHAHPAAFEDPIAPLAPGDGCTCNDRRRRRPRHPGAVVPVAAGIAAEEPRQLAAALARHEVRAHPRFVDSVPPERVVTIRSQSFSVASGVRRPGGARARFGLFLSDHPAPSGGTG
jgi:hypothetical protein